MPFFFFGNPEVLRARFADCFVGLSFPQVTVTLFIILSYFESPATTFGLVKANRFTADLGYGIASERVLKYAKNLTLLDIIFIIYLDWKYKSKYIRKNVRNRAGRCFK